jgi:GntR family transcriptional regulator
VTFAVAQPLTVPGRSPTLATYRALQEVLARFDPGTRLPGERVLAQQLGVSRATVRQALVALAEGGLLEPSANRGWFVAGPRISEGPNVLRSFSDTARERGLVPTATVLRQQVCPVSLEEAEVLKLAPAADVLDLERCRAMDGVALSVERTRLPLARFPGLDALNLTDCSLYQLLTERYEVIPTRCDYEVQAEAASDRIADLLKIQAGSPVLVGYQTTFDQFELPIGTGHAVYRGDAYRFKASLFRS